MTSSQSLEILFVVIKKFLNMFYYYKHTLRKKLIYFISFKKFIKSI